LREPVIVNLRAARMGDGPAHDAGKDEAVVRQQRNLVFLASAAGLASFGRALAALYCSAVICIGDSREKGQE